jgi:hypothetical protein
MWNNGIKRTCVAGNKGLCHDIDMAAFFRRFFVILLAVTLLGATSFELSANVTAEIAAAADPCCDGDCSGDPACETSCTMTQRCGTGLTAWLQVYQPNVLAALGVATLFPDDQGPPTGLAPHGLKRPPRV